jgi:NAD(P)-dependent dehydrogenase (short-subunit alcohol dehydrogenase family)
MKLSRVRLLSGVVFIQRSRFPIAGGSAAPAVCSAEDGEDIVKVALERFGGVHVLIANAGILRDKSFTAMTEKEWDQVFAVHLRYVSPTLLVGLSADATCVGVPTK